MATLPPRRNPTPTKISKQHLTPLQILLQMGFPKHRAEKALAATGNRGVQLASDWLLAHVNDVFLDDTTPREYILYACPVGAFLEDLRNLWGLSMSCCGWNGAHNFTPHITLVSFFKAPDENSLYLAQALKSVMERQGATLNECLKLETYISPNFMGLFVADEHADYLKRIAMQYVKEVSNAIISDTYEHFDALTACFPWCSNTTARCIPRGSRSISLEPHVKSLHLTLAYQFPSQHYAQLKGLVEFLNPNASSEWELRLYSRDARVNGKQVYKVVHAYTPQENDELELHIGDYVYLTSDAVSSSPDGWVDGVSWLTGLSGLLPASYTIRTAESDAWTLHTKVALNNLSGVSSTCPPATVTASSSDETNERLSSSSPSVDSVATPGTPAQPTMGGLTGGTDERDGVGVGSIDPLGVGGEGESEQLMFEQQENGGKDGEVYENMTKGRRNELLETEQTQNLYIMRHGERVDFTYGSWIPYCFDEQGVYTRRDLNMPATIPNRKKGAKGFQKDSPLTNVGILQATLVGEGLLAKKVVIAQAYCSPSLRCIQTCDAVLKGLNLQTTVQINVEPGLFEWLVWYPEYFPDWLDTDELLAAGYNVNPDYAPFITKEKLSESPETCEQFYHRSNYVSQSALEVHKAGDVLFVGHATTLEVCSRELTGGQPLDAKEMTKILKKVPYCSLVTLKREADNTWMKIEPPCPPVTHSNNPRFDWKIVS